MTEEITIKENTAKQDFLFIDGIGMNLSQLPEYLKRADVGYIGFKKQQGPIKEVGVNGLQIDDLIEIVKNIIESLNSMFPCRENSMVITKLDEAQLWLLKRKLDREKRMVEGTSIK